MSTSLYIRARHSWSSAFPERPRLAYSASILASYAAALATVFPGAAGAAEPADGSGETRGRLPGLDGSGGFAPTEPPFGGGSGFFPGLRRGECLGGGAGAAAAGGFGASAGLLTDDDRGVGSALRCV